MRWACAFLTALVAVPPAMAQTTPGPPGPYIIDVRGTTIGLPTGATFFPAVSSTAIVPARAFGLDAGGHAYVASWKAARIGVGASLLVARGTAPDVNATLRVIAPQVSLNFGTSDGWSHLSAGLGRGHLQSGRVAATAESGADEGQVGLSVRALNFGGGARWFIKRRLAVGFDIRMHKLAGGTAKPGGGATPGATLIAASAGLSFR